MIAKFSGFFIGFLWVTLSFRILLLPIMSLRLFGHWLTSMSGSWKLSFVLGFNFKIYKCFLIIWAISGRVLLNVVSRGMWFNFSFGFSFSVSCLGVVIVLLIWFSINCVYIHIYIYYIYNIVIPKTSNYS